MFSTSAHLKERSDRIDGSRIFSLRKEIATLSQGTSFVVVYYSRMKDLWEESEALVPVPGCTCEKSRDNVQFLQRQKLFQFFMGLNNTYLQARNQILLMNPLSSINQAFAMIMGDESKKSVIHGNSGPNIASSVSNFENVVMYVKRGAH